MSMGEQIKAMRQIRGLTQGELAVKVEMATITIQQYERGVRTPKIEALQKIAQALEMPIGTFLPSMGMTENFGFRVRETRKKQHLSMEQLGQKMGISGSLVGRYERNEEHPKPDTIRRFSDALGVDAKWLERESTMTTAYPAMNSSFFGISGQCPRRGSMSHWNEWTNFHNIQSINGGFER